MKLFFFSFIFFLIPTIALTDIFKSIDNKGNVIYSDSPLNDKAEKIELPNEEQTTGNSTREPTQEQRNDQNNNQQNLNQLSEKVDSNVTVKKVYTKFMITSPADQATIQNQPIIYIDISLVPELQKGDTIQIYLDGHPWGNALASTHFQLPRPDRGTHQLSAKLIDNNKSIVNETRVNTIYIHQAHIPTQAPAFKSPF